MKKILAFILCTCLVISINACTFGDPTNTDPPIITDPSEDNTASGETLPPVTYQTPMVAVSVPVITQSSKAASGETIFNYSYQNINLILSDPQVADRIVIDFLTRMDYTSTPAQSVLDAAKSNFSKQKDWKPYSYRKAYSPVRLDQNVLSFYGSESIFNGGPRPTNVNITVTYDLATGKALELRDVLAADYSAPALCKLITEALADYARQDMLFIDYEYIISDMFSTNIPIETWYLSQNGLCFYFAPYEIAPYSSGTVVAEIPYTKLAGLIKDQYFPPEQPALFGNPLLSKFTPSDTESYKQLAELILDSDGEQYIVHTDGTLFNLSIQTGTWSSDSKNFTADGTIFAAAALSAGDGIIVQATKETLETLQLTCTSGGKTTSCKPILLLPIP